MENSVEEANMSHVRSFFLITLLLFSLGVSRLPGSSETSEVFAGADSARSPRSSVTSEISSVLLELEVRLCASG